MKPKTIRSIISGITTALLFLFMPLAARAQFTLLTNTDDTLTITAYTGSSDTVIIPTTTNGLTVTVVGNSNAVFSSSITNITIPNGITAIGDYAFSGSGVAEVVIPNTVTSVGAFAFANCASLTNIVLSSNITAIATATFVSCPLLANVVIPKKVTTIDYNAFAHCANLQNVIIPPTVTTIVQEAYLHSQITNLVIGTNRAGPWTGCSIEEQAFAYCYGMTNVQIGTTVTSIADLAFGNCTMSNLTIGVNDPAARETCSIGLSAFANCAGLSNVFIGNNVTDIGTYAFENCQMVNLTIGGNFPGLNGGCFIDVNAFTNAGMTTLSLGGNVTTAAYLSFQNCTNLTAASVNADAIGQYAFEGCTVLSNLTFGPGTTTIEDGAFLNCYALHGLYLPDNIVSIGFNAFDFCTNLGSIVIGKGVTSIPSDAFENCTALTNVVFGPGITTLGYDVFYNCTNLTALYFQGNAPIVDQLTFENATNSNTTVYYYTGTKGWEPTLDGIPTVLLGANTFEVILGPTAAINAGGQFVLDGVSPIYNSTTNLIDIVPGERTITFAPVAGWNSPSNRTINITNGSTLIIALYTPINTPSDGLILLTNGVGTITHSVWPTNLIIGKKYTVVAHPGVNSFFDYWIGGSNQNYSILSRTASYTFTMQSNLVLDAYFSSNPYNPGIYNGLFYTTNGVAEATSGMIRNLTISKAGTYTAAFLLNGSTYGLGGKFNLSGVASNLVGRPATNGGPVRVVLNLYTPDGFAPEVVGTVAGTNFGVPWTADLLAYYATNDLPSAEYTVLISPDLGSSNTPPALAPGGASFLLVSNYAGTAAAPHSANAKITGYLADGSTFTQTVGVSQTGYVPLFANLYLNTASNHYATHGLILGWLDLPSTNLDGSSVSWIHPPATNGLYRLGFTNNIGNDGILVSTWTNPPAALGMLSNVSLLPVVDATNGLSFPITISPTGQITGTNITGTVTLKTGLVKVNIGGISPPVTGYGAILQNTTNGGGYYLTATNAQAIEISP